MDKINLEKKKIKDVQKDLKEFPESKFRQEELATWEKAVADLQSQVDAKKV